MWRVKSEGSKKLKELFCKQPDRVFNVDELADLTGLTVKEVRRHIQNFHRSGHVSRQGKQGKFILYKLARRNEDRPEPSTELSALDSGLAIIALVDDLRKRLAAAESERDELKELLEDYDRISADNRVMHERITELSTRLSAANGRTLKL